MNTYEDPSWVTGRPRTFQSDDFGFTEADDFITETLNSLQDLDIPVGEHPQLQPPPPQYAGYAPQVGGHKKQPSGTAIFGFVQHNKTLSIPGVGMGHSKKQSMANQVVAPQQVFQEQHNQQVRQEPVLFQTPEDFHMAHMYAGYSHGNMIPAYSQQVYPPQSQQSLQQQPQQRPIPVRQQNDDYIVTNKTPYGYKFPPETIQQVRHAQNPHMPYQHTQGPIYQQTPMAPAQQHASLQKTVQVPVEYLQKLTKMIKDTKGVDMENFLNYDFDKLSSAQPDMVPSSPTRVSSEISPTLKTYQSSNSSGSNQSREQTPELDKLTANSSPLKIINVQPAISVSSPSKSNNMGLGIMHDSEEQFKECPKTPSPTLRSQAKFTGSPMKNDISWTPVVIGNSDGSRPIARKKVYDKASTLPPGQIDQYIIGPREDKTLICNFNGCGKVFTRRYNVRSHVQTHLSDRPFHCPVPGCKKAFVRQHDLTRHKKIHQEFAFQCECGKKFSRQDALFRHRERNICQGGLDPQEVSRILLRQSQTSVRKKKKERPSVRVPNDTVAKKLEFDLMSCMKKKKKSQSTPSSPRKVSGASTIDEDDLEEGEVDDDDEEEEEEYEDEEEHEDRHGDDEKEDEDVFQAQETTPVGGLGLMQHFTNVNLEISDDEDNVFLNDLNFDGFDLDRPTQRVV